MNDTHQLRQKLVLAYHILAMEGQADFHLGHISAREPGTDTFWMKRAGIGMEEVTPDNLVLLDYDGNILRGEGPRHLEYPLHAEVYRHRADVQAVTHTHPEHCIALGAGDEPFHPLSNDGTFFEPTVPLFEEFTDLVMTREQGEKTAKALGGARALLLRNHGILVAGASVEEACLGALLLERAARIQLLAAMQSRYFPQGVAPRQGLAGSATWTSTEEVRLKREHIYSQKMIESIWEYECRKLERIARPPAGLP